MAEMNIDGNPITADLGPQDTQAQVQQATGTPDQMVRDSGKITRDTLTGGQVETDAPINNRRDPNHATPLGSSFRALVLGSKNRKALSPEAQIYLTTMTDFLKRYRMNVVEMPNDGVYLATDGNSSIALLFNEVMRAPSVDDEFIPASAHIPRILGDEIFQDALEKKRISNVDEAIIIPKTDYIDLDAGANNANNRAVNIANIAGNSVRNVLQSALDTEITIEDMAHFPIRLVTNQNEVANHVAECCPSGVLPYYQVGVAAEICLDPRVLTARDRGRNFDRDQYDWQPLFVLGAATEFIDTHNDGPEGRFLPIVTVTVCESTVKSLKMLPFMLSVAAEVFIQQGTYLEYFKNWGEDNPNPNLGQLVWDSRDNRLAPPILNAREWDEFVRKAIANPVLAVDVRVGCWNHPAFECMLDQRDGIPLLQAELDQLDPGARLDLSNLVRDSVDFYCGNLIDNGVTVDSRSIDYFKIVKTQQDQAILESFLGFTDNPEDRIKAIAACGWRPTSQGLARGIKTIDSLYDCWRMVLDATTVCDMFNLAGNLAIIRNLKQGSNLKFDFTTLRDIGSVYSRRDRTFLRNDNRAYSGFNSSYMSGYFWRRR